MVEVPADAALRALVKRRVAEDMAVVAVLRHWEKVTGAQIGEAAEQELVEQFRSGHRELFTRAVEASEVVAPRWAAVNDAMPPVFAELDRHWGPVRPAQWPAVVPQAIERWDTDFPHAPAASLVKSFANVWFPDGNAPADVSKRFDNFAEHLTLIADRVNHDGEPSVLRNAVRRLAGLSSRMARTTLDGGEMLRGIIQHQPDDIRHPAIERALHATFDSYLDRRAVAARLPLQDDAGVAGASKLVERWFLNAWSRAVELASGDRTGNIDGVRTILYGPDPRPGPADFHPTPVPLTDEQRATLDRVDAYAAILRPPGGMQQARAKAHHELTDLFRESVRHVAYMSGPLSVRYGLVHVMQAPEFRGTIARVLSAERWQDSLIGLHAPVFRDRNQANVLTTVDSYVAALAREGMGPAEELLQHQRLDRWHRDHLRGWMAEVCADDPLARHLIGNCLDQLDAQDPPAVAQGGSTAGKASVTGGRRLIPVLRRLADIRTANVLVLAAIGRGADPSTVKLVRPLSDPVLTDVVNKAVLEHRTGAPFAGLGTEPTVTRGFPGSPSRSHLRRPSGPSHGIEGPHSAR